ncbi:CoA transferase [Nocardioides zeae]|uniref:CoA transferase n=1 Tax=Nocardioides imazamoxiresistens TaxID=3231893 RepID=A0ABU3PSH0_9ACTN|nr:CoA transferase [Nocardioides zeae]MDT9592162.1 CoA transferase [Nocardioides zeae]
MPQSSSAPPLDGVRVLDLTRVVSGPFGSLMLADLGAEVIRVEAVPTGDEAPDGSQPLTEEEAFSWGLARNKHSVSLDLKSAEGRDLMLRLVEQADVVLDNFRPGVMDRLGLDRAALEQRNPAIVSCSLTGFGGDGPWATMPAYDPIVQALSGTMNYTRLGVDSPPVRWGIPIGDLYAGVMAAIGVVGAIVHRDRTGVGQHVDVSMLDVMLALNTYRVPQALTFDQEPCPSPFEGGQGTVPFGNFRCREGWVALCISQRMWADACRILGRPDLATDPRFATQAERYAHRDEITAILQDELRARTADEWQAEFMASGVVVCKVQGVAEVFDHPQVLARGMSVDITDHRGRTATVAGDPLKFSDPAAWWAPRPVGADTAHVLTALLGVPADELERLDAAGALHLSREEGVPAVALRERFVPTPDGSGRPTDRPLAGTVVLELNGDEPSKGFAAQLLTDLGARVLRVDRPVGQHLEPYPDVAREAIFRAGLNRGKESVTADLKTDEGRAFLRSLAAHADVVLDNYRPGVLERLGADLASLQEVRPDLVSCSITGFGHSGPWSAHPAFDPAIQALGGGMSVTVDHTQPDVPVRWGNPIGGLTGSLFAALGVLATERRRRLTGVGGRVDLALLDAQVALLSYRVPQAVTVGKKFLPEPRRGGSGSLPFGAFRTADDGWFVICITPQFWHRFCEAAGHPEWEHDPRFATEPLRRANEAELYRLVEPSFLDRTAAQWEELYVELRIPGARVLTIAEAFAHPQALARGMRMTLPDAVADGGVQVAGPALKFSVSAPPPAAAAPLPGVDTARVTTELGIALDTADLRPVSRLA